MDKPDVNVNDLVMIDDLVVPTRLRGTVFRVTKRLKVNVEMTPVAGGRPVRINPQLLVPAPPDAAAASAAAVDIAYREPPVRGQIVTIAGPGWHRPAGDLYVVLQYRDGKATVARLGGEGGTYWPRVPEGYLTIVDPEQVIRPAAG